MQILFSEKIQSIVYRKSIRLVFALMGIWLYGGLFFGTSNFLTTTYTYIIIGMIFYCIALWFKFTKEIKLVFFSFGIGLFLGEFILRYIVRYPLSYSEKNGRPYILVDNYQRKSNLRFKFFEGRKDLYTLQFDSGGGKR
jgi:hypothetical protein